MLSQECVLREREVCVLAAIRGRMWVHHAAMPCLLNPSETWATAHTVHTQAASFPRYTPPNTNTHIPHLGVERGVVNPCVPEAVIKLQQVHRRHHRSLDKPVPVCLELVQAKALLHAALDVGGGVCERGLAGGGDGGVLVENRHQLLWDGKAKAVQSRTQASRIRTDSRA